MVSFVLCRGLRHEGCPPLDVPAGDLHQALFLLRPKIGELASSAAGQDDVHAGLDHLVDVFQVGGLVDNFARSIEDCANGDANTGKLCHLLSPCRLAVSKGVKLRVEKQ